MSTNSVPLARVKFECFLCASHGNNFIGSCKRPIISLRKEYQKLCSVKQSNDAFLSATEESQDSSQRCSVLSTDLAFRKHNVR